MDSTTQIRNQIWTSKGERKVVFINNLYKVMRVSIPAIDIKTITSMIHFIDSKLYEDPTVNINQLLNAALNACKLSLILEAKKPGIMGN